MAADFIVINRVNRPQFGANLIRSAGDLIDFCDKIEVLNNAASRMVDGTDVTKFETQFGLTPGDGANLVNLILLIHEIFNTDIAVAGVDRLSRIKEFKARLAGQ